MPVAVDQHIFRLRKDAEGELFARVLKQAGRGTDGYSQGVYLFTADGTLLGFSNTADAKHVNGLLEKALKKFDPAAPLPKAPAGKAGAVLPPPPEGGLVLDVTTKLLGGYAADDERGQKYLKSLGRDHLWIRKDEADALGKGVLPDSVKQRLVRYHLIDNTRGEPPMCSAAEIKKLELTLRDGVLRGSVHLETKSGERGYRADLLGFVEAKDGSVTRFDLLARGEFWGEGPFTRGAPKGRFPLAIALSLADTSAGASGVPPQGARGNLKGYLK
ncbi:MAG: hypothetical protein U0793_01005 [Gemmataceae bacterium]